MSTENYHIVLQMSHTKLWWKGYQSPFYADNGVLAPGDISLFIYGMSLSYLGGQFAKNNLYNNDKNEQSMNSLCESFWGMFHLFATSKHVIMPIAFVRKYQIKP